MTSAAGEPRPLRQDVLAGLTVTLVGLPQCLAYALVAGLPPAYGLSTAAVAGFVAAIAQRTTHVVTGPTNTTGLLILAALAPYLGDNGLLDERFLPILASLTLLAGGLRIVGGLLRAGSLIRFIPESVLIGFLSGAGFLIAAMQVDEALGLTGVRGADLWSQIGAVLNANSAPRPLPIAFAIVTVLGIALFKKFAPKLPGPLIVLAVTAVAAYFLRMAGFELPVVSDVTNIPAGWPKGALPSTDWTIYRDLALPSLAIVLLGTLELTVVARREDTPPQISREIGAQGLANVAGAFTACIPASASLTRSALLEIAGARTRLAAAAAALFIVPVVFFGSRIVGAVPQSVLAGVLFITAWRMVGWKRPVRVWKTSKASRVLLGVTLIATITIPFVWAILLGVALGLLIHIQRSAIPRLTLLTPKDEGLLPLEPGASASTVVVEVSGELYFAAVNGLPEAVVEILPKDAKHVVLDITHARHGRFAAVEALERLSHMLEADGRILGLAGVSKRFDEIIDRVQLDIPHTTYDPVPGRAAILCVELISADC